MNRISRELELSKEQIEEAVLDYITKNYPNEKVYGEVFFEKDIDNYIYATVELEDNVKEKSASKNNKTRNRFWSNWLNW